MALTHRQHYDSIELFPVACSTIFSYFYVFESVVLSPFVSSPPHPPKFPMPTSLQPLRFSSAIASFPDPQADLYVSSRSAMAH